MVYITRVSPVLRIYLFGTFEELIMGLEMLLTKITGEKAEMRISEKVDRRKDVFSLCQEGISKKIKMISLHHDHPNNSKDIQSTLW